MKSLICVIAVFVAVAEVASQARAENVVAVEPVIVHFGPAHQVFVKPGVARKVIDETRSQFMGQQHTLDGIAQTKTGQTWCKRVSPNAYKDPFLVKNVSLKLLNAMESASASELTRLLGEPIFRRWTEGP
jgi:hypothetical protein